MLIGYARTSTLEQEAGLEAQKRDRRIGAILSLAEEDRVFALQFHEFRRKDRHEIDRIPIGFAMPPEDPEIPMFGVIEQNDIGHEGSFFPLGEAGPIVIGPAPRRKLVP